MQERPAQKGIDRRAFIASIASLGIVATLSGCAKTAVIAKEDNEPTQVGSLSSGRLTKKICNFAINNPASIDPYNCYDSWGAQVCSLLFDCLTAYDAKSDTVVPAVAENWTVDDTATIYTFSLVRNTLFHNGDVVSAKDFKYAWERIANPKTNPDTPSQISYLLANVKGYQEFVAGSTTGIEGLKVVDEYTYQVTLAKPFADFITLVSHPALAPVPKAAEDFAQFYPAPIGNGPFQIDGSWIDGQFIKLIKYEDYYGENSSIDGINFLIYKDETSAFEDFNAGSLDFSPVPSTDFSRVLTNIEPAKDGFTATPDTPLLIGPEHATLFLQLNLLDELLSDINIRRAISLSINREEICNTIWNGLYLPASGIIPEGMPTFVESSWPDVRFDPEAAIQALAAAGYDGVETKPSIKLSYELDSDTNALIDMLVQYLTAVGFIVETEGTPWSQYFSSLQNKTYQIAPMSWIAEYPSSSVFLEPLFFTGAMGNISSYSNPVFDEAIAMAQAMPIKEDRYAALRELDSLVGIDLPVVPLSYYRHHHVVSNRMTSLYYGSNGLARLDTATMT